MLTITAGLPAMGSDPEEERFPPPTPTPLDFPIPNPPDVPETASESSLRGMQAVLASIKRPQDISRHRFKDLNLKVESDIPATEIVYCHDRAKSAPPLPWELDSSDPLRSLGQAVSEDGSLIFMENGNAYPPKEKFEALERELLIENDDAFREVARLPPRPGRDRVRVTQARKFWTALERMSQYWDDSLDEYFERPKTPEPGPQSESKLTGEGRPGNDDQMQTDDAVAASNQSQSDAQRDLDNDCAPRAPASGESEDPKDEEQQPVKQQELVKRYRGRRIAAGTDMPEDVREETVRALTEMAAWPFGCQVSLPIMPPRLAVGTLLFPVRKTFEATRAPKDRQLARNGMLEGPVFVAQCRNEASFRGPEEAPGSGFGDTCDLMREVGSMLLAAQERAREGRMEVRPGEGKWYTTTPRWGGAPNDAIGDSAKVLSEQERQASGNNRKRSKYEHSLLGSRRPGIARKMSNSEKWKIVQPGPPLWDRRMRYIQIGKPKDSPFDDIYMLSSINHHLAILHLRVHRRYIDILATGKSNFSADSNTSEQPWHVLQLRRTRWFDLFDTQDRLEVFRGIWTLFHCLLRSM
ncbi:hypothetical protein P175DRAFT_0442278 [Aspergillus ochraceoroseus IBT 24754]|uniref:Uncharacterized protein n=2 Tax=Aspergillus ochraceoroseus TaxID=138278 RepID=A0A2T5LQR6_9EURO|nr:uncharacterized protein P175DRAFT_0442278 [Aspergillus ochraceoroseus IBT 24754]PTU18619.1 hypothetical protein P175DRAFT_0442278 [Aspergillus ochraceoroseus IBT 24754]